MKSKGFIKMNDFTKNLMFYYRFAKSNILAIKQITELSICRQ